MADQVRGASINSPYFPRSSMHARETRRRFHVQVHGDVHILVHDVGHISQAVPFHLHQADVEHRKPRWTPQGRDWKDANRGTDLHESSSTSLLSKMWAPRTEAERAAQFQQSVLSAIGSLRTSLARIHPRRSPTSSVEEEQVLVVDYVKHLDDGGLRMARLLAPADSKQSERRAPCVVNKIALAQAQRFEQLLGRKRRSMHLDYGGRRSQDGECSKCRHTSCDNCKSATDRRGRALSFDAAFQPADRAEVVSETQLVLSSVDFFSWKEEEAGPAQVADGQTIFAWASSVIGATYNWSCHPRRSLVGPSKPRIFLMSEARR